MKAYKYKLRPTKKLAKVLESILDICRETYNAALQERRDAYKFQQQFSVTTRINFYSQDQQLPQIKPIRDDVASIYSQVLQDVLHRVDKSFKRFFDRVKKGQTPGYPRFKGKRHYDSFCYPQSGFKLVGNKLHLAKIGSMRLHLSRPIEGKLKTCTIKREGGCWFVMFAVEENQSAYYAKTGQTTGIDLGIENFAALSNGEMIENPKYLRQAEKRLKTAQRKVSRRKKRSSNRKKAVKLLAKQHLKVKRQREDFFHKTALELVKKYDCLVFEDLKIANMVKNHHLAKSIADASWRTFQNITQTKAESAGRKYVEVSPMFSSQECSQCHNRVKKTLAQREHRCIACGFVAHRDTNAAIIIEHRGRAVPLGIVG